MSKRSRRFKRYSSAGAPPLGTPPLGFPQIASGPLAGGWGVGNKKAMPASGQYPSVNPFLIPKGAGLNIVSQTFPNNYWVEWNLSTWRAACDQAIQQGYTMSIAALYAWAYECSPFIQSLFRALSAPIGKIPFIFTDEKGNELPEWTAELCGKSWHKELRTEIAMSNFWGFTGLNIDPINGAIYKYPMQDIDPINRLIKQNTFSFFDGVNFADSPNLLFVQPSTSYERFLGWMQPITRSFIQMNLNKNNWIAAGRKLAFPMLTVGYPQNGGDVDPTTGEEVNPYKLQAENIASNIDPTKGLVYPYTIDPTTGNIQKAIDINMEGGTTGSKTHEIYSDFNNSEKDEIREFILGGTLTSSVGDSGSRALGDIQMEKLDSVIEDLIEFVENYLNDQYLKKISAFYTNLPAGGRFAANKAKQLSIEDMQSLGQVLNQSGKRFTDEFFENNGLVREFFEDAPSMGIPSADDDSEDTEFRAVLPSRSIFSKKKFL